MKAPNFHLRSCKTNCKINNYDYDERKKCFDGCLKN